MQTMQICILSLPSSYKYTTYEVLKMGMPKLLLQPIPSCSFTYSRQLGETAGKLPHKLKEKKERLNFTLVCTDTHVHVHVGLHTRVHDDISLALEVCCGTTYMYL